MVSKLIATANIPYPLCLPLSVIGLKMCGVLAHNWKQWMILAYRKSTSTLHG